MNNGNMIFPQRCTFLWPDFMIENKLSIETSYIIQNFFFNMLGSFEEGSCCFPLYENLNVITSRDLQKELKALLFFLEFVSLVTLSKFISLKGF
jgi:hypothetical protein